MKKTPSTVKVPIQSTVEVFRVADVDLHRTERMQTKVRCILGMRENEANVLK